MSTEEPSDSKRVESPKATPDGKEAQGWMERLGKLGKNLALVAGIFTALSTMGGLTWSLIESARSTREQRFADRISQLTSFSDFGAVLKRHHEIGDLSNQVTQRFRGRVLNCDSLLDMYGSGAALYYSDEMEEYAEVREFYENLGILVRYKALEFEIVFQAIIFPTDFVAATMPLTRCIGENWFGRGDGVPQFSLNMLQLGENYDRRRKGEPLIWDAIDD